MSAPIPAAEVFPQIERAAERLAGHANVTPIHRSRTLDQRIGARVFLKCENFQRVGAFKFRGAYNAMSQLSLLSVLWVFVSALD